MPDRMKTVIGMSLVRPAVALALLCGIGSGTGGFTEAHAAAPIADRLIGSHPQAPLSFEPDLDTHQPPGSFLIHASGYSAVVGPTSLSDRHRGWAEQRTALVSRRQSTGPYHSGKWRLPGLVSYFQSRDPDLRDAGLPAFNRLLVPNLYPGIDLVYYLSRQGLEYDLVVHPGADPHRIRMTTHGGRLDAQGSLVWKTAGGTFALAAPSIYQQAGRHRVSGGYSLSPT